MSNIAGLKDLNKNKEERQKKQDEFFIGGLDGRGGGSGLAVLGPPDKKDAKEKASVLDDIVAKASSEGENGSSSDSDSSNRRKITLYKNGFTVDDGQFRDLEAPESQAFLSSLLRGEVPHGMYYDLAYLYLVQYTYAFMCLSYAQS